MEPMEWVAMAEAAATIINTLQKNQPAGTAEAPLTPEEQAAVDSANETMNQAIAAWDATGAGQTSDTPPETPEP